MKRIFSYLSPYKARIALGLFFKIAGTVAELVLPLIMSYMIDDVVPTGDILALSLWGGGMLLAAVVALLGNVKANRMASRVARDTTERLRADLFCKTLSLSARQADEVTIPSLVSRLSSDTYNVHNMIGMMQRLGVRAPILLVGGVTLTFIVDPVLALVLLAVVPVITLIVVLVTRRGVSLYTRLQRSADGMVRKVRDDYSGIRVIKALSKGGYESASFRAVNEEVSRCETKANVTMGVTNPLLNAVLNLGMAAVIFIGAYRVADGRAMAGDIIAFTSYFSIILNAVISVGRIFVNMTKGSASARRIDGVLSLPAELAPLPDGAAERDENETIRFEHVSFSYGGAPALEDVSFSLARIVRRGDRAGSGVCACRRFHPRARGVRRRSHRQRRQLQRRTETAPAHRPRAGGGARDPRAGRFLQRARLPHGRRAAQERSHPPSRDFRRHDRPAHQFRALCR